MIVVVGGGGLLGRQVVDTLVAAGQPVRVVVRDVTRARDVLPPDVEIRAGDVRRMEGLDDLLIGASVVVGAFHGFLGGRGAGLREVDEHGTTNLADAAARAGAGVVLVSVIGAAPDSGLELGRAKHAAEQHLRASGAPWTIVRAGPFLETWLAVLAQTAGAAGRPLVFGRGDRPLPFVSATDVAHVVTRAVLDTTLRGTVLEAAGAALTMTELAQSLQAARGWQGGVRHLPRPVLRALGALAGPVAPAFARKNRAALAMDSGAVPVRAATGDLLGRAPLRADDVLRRVVTGQAVLGE